MSLVDRLSSFFLVHGAERRQFLYLVALFWVIGAGLAVGQGAAHALFLKRYGIEHLPLVYVALSAVLAATGFGYAAVIDRFPSERLLRYGFLVIVVLALASNGLMRWSSGPLVFAGFFLLYEVSSEWLLAHSGWYLSQNLDVMQLKRLTPLVLAGWQLGILSGGLLLAGAAPLAGVVNVTLVWCLLLAGALALVWQRHHRYGVSRYYRPQRGRVDTGAGNRGEGGLRAVLKSPFLRSSLLAMFFLVITMYTLTYSVSRVYTTAFQDEAALGAFFGKLLMLTGGLALFLQIFFVSRLLRWIGAPRANLVFPVAGLASFGLLFSSFAVPAAVIGSVVKDAVVPAIHRPARQLMLSAVPASLQGRARAAMLVCVPAALCTTGLLLHFGQEAGGPSLVLGFGALAATALLFFSWQANAAYPRTLISTLEDQVFVPQGVMDVPHGDTLAPGTDAERASPEEEGGTVESNLERAIELRYAADVLHAEPDSTPQVRLLALVLNENWAATVDRCLSKLAETEDKNTIETVRAALRSREARHVAMATEALHSLRETRYARELSALLDRVSTTTTSCPASGLHLASVADVAAWCQKSGDAWLSECARCVGQETMPELLRRILLLKGTSVFHEVGTHELRMVAQELKRERLHAGERVFDINEPSDRFYVIDVGRIGISTHPTPTEKVFVVIFGPGGCFGEIGCFDHLPRSATAHVLEDVTLLGLEKSKLHGLVLRYPELSLGLLRGIGTRLREVTQAGR